jgi:hypothetical protein
MRITEAVTMLVDFLVAQLDAVVIEALGRIGTDEAVEALLAVYPQANDSGKSAKIILALGESANPNAKHFLLGAYHNPSEMVRSAVISALRSFPDQDTLPVLLEALEDSDQGVQFCAVRRFRERDDADLAIPKLIEVMESNGSYLGYWRYEEIPIEIPLYMAAAFTLRNLDEQVAQAALAEWLQDHTLPDFAEFKEDY